MAFDRDLVASAVATSYPVGTAPVLVAPANAARGEVKLAPAGPAYVGLASSFVASSGLPVASGTVFSESLHVGDIYAKAEAATIAVVRWESSY